MFNRILVPLDGSPLAERAIPHAMHFARIFGGKIILLQVLDPTPYRESITSVEPLNWQIRKMETDLYLKGIAERIRAQNVPAEYILREGRPPENIVDFAQNESIDLLVLSTHGSGGLTRWNISSVVMKVIEKVYMPVLIVRAYNFSTQNGHSEAAAAESTPSAESSGQAAAVTGTAKAASFQVPSPAALSIPVTTTPTAHSEYAGIHYRRILLPIDSSRRAECSLSPGIGLAEGELRLAEQAASTQSRNGEAAAAPPAEPADPSAMLLLAAVIRPPELPIPAPYPDEVQQLSDQFMKISRELVTSYLDELRNRVPVQTEKLVVENESVSAAIHELVEKENADLVILCAHGMTGRGVWPYGSVARNYIDHGAQTVLIIQDVPRAQVRQTPAEIAAEKYGSR